MVYFGTVILIFVELPNCIISEPAFDSSIFFTIILVELEVPLKQEDGEILFPNENDGVPRDVETMVVCASVVGIFCVVLQPKDVVEGVEADVEVRVRFRFQQSGNIFFCSSAITLAR